MHGVCNKGNDLANWLRYHIHANCNNYKFIATNKVYSLEHKFIVFSSKDTRYFILDDNFTLDDNFIAIY